MCPSLSFTALPAPEKIWKQLAWWWFLQPFLCFFFGGLASSSLLLPKSAYPLNLNNKILSPQSHDFPSLSNPRLVLTSIHTHNKQLGHPLISLSLSLCLWTLYVSVSMLEDWLHVHEIFVSSFLRGFCWKIHLHVQEIIIVFCKPKTKASAVNEHNAEWF
jgi:hypothetical protein